MTYATPNTPTEPGPAPTPFSDAPSSDRAASGADGSGATAVDALPSQPHMDRATGIAPDQLTQAPDQLTQAIAAQQWRAATLLCARQYGADVGRLCMAMLGEQSLADEAAQDALLAAFEGFPSYRAEAPVRAWLLGIARKKCLRLLEQRRRLSALTPQPIPDEPNAEEWLVRKAKAQQARTALAQIRPSEREALLLRYQSELSYDDIAAICALDSGAARKRVSRALLHLRALLAETEVDSKDREP